jgi:hypothetical protein
MREKARKLSRIEVPEKLFFNKCTKGYKKR